MQAGNDADSVSSEYIVGEEKTLRDVLDVQEAGDLIGTSLAAGADSAAINLADGSVFKRCGSEGLTAGVSIDRALVLEGETVGRLVISGPRERESLLSALSGVLAHVLEAIMHNNLKRSITTEVHTKVLDLSYQELMETNHALKASEEKYRRLSERLEEEVRERTRELQDAYARMLQEQNMSAVGQLAAGLAHEINNPIGFVKANLGSLNRYTEKLREMISFFRSATRGSVSVPFDPLEAERKWSELKIDFIMSDLPDLVGQCLEGSERVQKIISDLMGFSGVYADSETLVDIAGEIDKTLRMMSGQMPEDAVVAKEYSPVPRILVCPPLFCQVIYNILLNSIQSRGRGLRILIRTEASGGRVRISLEDNGPGIPQGICEKVFEPFFTTREVGCGKGLGLTIAYNIVRKYRGSIRTGASRDGGAAVMIELPAGES